MSRAKSIAAVLLCFVMVLPGFGQTPVIAGESNHGVISRLINPYTTHPVSKISFEDSPRIDKLMRAGNIYLSLRDAIALALENNLDLELARLNPKLSETNLLRANAGQLLRNVSNNISNGPSSASLGALGGVNAVGSSSSGASSGGGNGGVLSGLSVQLAGSAIPNLDPTVFLNGQFQHQTSIQTNTIATGTNFLVSQFKTASYGIQQGFLTGTSVSLGMGNTIGFSQNSPNNQFNPFTTANLQFAIQQNLLQGFRPSVNNRAIRVAKNQLHASDLSFKQQVIATTTSVVNLYWDLVSFNEAFRVKQQALELNKKLYEDNKRRAELGAIAPIDIVQAEAEMKASQQDVTTAETQVLQQEMILKSVLTRSGVDNLAIANAHIIPTDHYEVPAQESVQPIQDLVAEALRNRPEIEQSQIALENSQISMLGTKNALLPQLSVFATLQNSGLAGQVNSLPIPVTQNGVTTLVQRTAADVNPFFLGGYGTVLNQLFSRKFPNYSAGFSLNIPIRNRAAQADLITDELNYRQQQIQDKQLHNNLKLNVVNARTAQAQARAAYDTSVEARKLQDQTLAGEKRKYELGTSNILQVVIVQRDAVARELAEVDARNQYIRSHTALEQILGRILQDYEVDIQQAKAGVVGRDPDPIPAVIQNPGGQNPGARNPAITLKR